MADFQKKKTSVSYDKVYSIVPFIHQWYHGPCIPALALLLLVLTTSITSPVTCHERPLGLTRSRVGTPATAEIVTNASDLSDAISPLMDETNESHFHYFASTLSPELLTTKASPFFNLIGNSSSTAYFDPMVSVTPAPSSPSTFESYSSTSSSANVTGGGKYFGNDTNSTASTVSTATTTTSTTTASTMSKSSHRPQETTFKSSSPSLMSPHGITSTPPPLTSASIESPHKASLHDSRVIKSTESISHGKKKFKHQSDENWHEFTLASWDSKRHKTSSSSLTSRLDKLKERNLPVLRSKFKEQINSNSSDTRRRQNRISYASNVKPRKSGPLFGNGSRSAIRPMDNLLNVVPPEDSPNESADLSLLESKNDQTAPVDIVGRRAGLSSFYFNMRRDSPNSPPALSSYSHSAASPSASATASNAAAVASRPIPKLLLPNFKRPRMYSLDGYIPKPNLQKYEHTRAPKKAANAIEEGNADELRSNSINKRQGDFTTSHLRRKAAFTSLIDLSSSESNYEHHSAPADRSTTRRRHFKSLNVTQAAGSSRTIPKLLLPEFTRPRMYSLNGFIPKPNLHRLSQSQFAQLTASEQQLHQQQHHQQQQQLQQQQQQQLQLQQAEAVSRRVSDEESGNLRRKDDDSDVTFISSKDTPAPLVHVPRLLASSSNNRQNKIPAMKQKLKPNQFFNETERRRKFTRPGQLFNLGTRRNIARRNANTHR